MYYIQCLTAVLLSTAQTTQTYVSQQRELTQNNNPHTCLLLGHLFGGSIAGAILNVADRHSGTIWSFGVFCWTKENNNDQ